ncbi:MAG TPA: PilZ domain-containing protein [Bradyrhizobium sp.]|nr:PilZ domain-containing protein [Bradyrhizobium sp.]
MAVDKRRAKRVEFYHEAIAIAADGTWSIKGQVEDISATGAKLHIFEKINARMRTEEFFLALTLDGRVKRRSKMIWETKSSIGIEFLASKSG